MYKRLFDCSVNLLSDQLFFKHRPGVVRGQWASVSLPGDVGLRDPVYLTGESGHAPFVYSHGLRVGQELGQSCDQMIRMLEQ